MRAMAADAPTAHTPRVVSRLNPANVVTASRFLMLPLFVWAVDRDAPQWATLFMFLCGILDKLDGFVATVFDCKSEFGELFVGAGGGQPDGAHVVVEVDPVDLHPVARAEHGHRLQAPAEQR